MALKKVKIQLQMNVEPSTKHIDWEIILLKALEIAAESVKSHKTVRSLKITGRYWSATDLKPEL